MTSLEAALTALADDRNFKLGLFERTLAKLLREYMKQVTKKPGRYGRRSQ